MKLFKKSLFSLFLFSTKTVWAAACCGGGFAMPSLITGDDQAMFTASVSHSKIDTDVYASGIWQKRSRDDTSQVLRLEGARILNDRYQAGVSVPLQTRERSGALGGNTSGLGDVMLQTGYEYLPDWDYNPWRPHGVGFLSLTLPTGKSIYEDTSLGLESRGRGFWAVGVGTALTKNGVTFDANATLEIHRSFEKPVHTSEIEGTIKPGTGGNLSLGSGYNYKNLRLGGAIAWAYEDAIDVVNSSGTSLGSAQRFATATLSSSYLFADNWAGTFSYSDQTLMGAPSNTSLSKSLALSIQKRWSR